MSGQFETITKEVRALTWERKKPGVFLFDLFLLCLECHPLSYLVCPLSQALPLFTDSCYEIKNLHAARLKNCNLIYILSIKELL